MSERAERIQELLEANNREVERRRAAEVVVRAAIEVVAEFRRALATYTVPGPLAAKLRELEAAMKE